MKSRANDLHIEKYVFIILFFILFSALAFLFPITGDDYGWGSGFGESLFEKWFKDYNGRYLGNLLALILTRARPFSPFFVSFVVSSIVYVVYMLSGGKNIEALYMTGALVLLVSSMFRQVYSWVSGFSNYVPSVLLLLLFLYMAERCFKQPDHSATRISYVFAVLIGVSVQLFMEHTTIYCLAASLSFAIAWRVKHKKYNSLLNTFFFSCLAGAIIMFSNEAYLRILNKDDSYRSIASNDGGLLQTTLDIVKTFCERISEIMYKSCYAAIAAICVLSVILILKSPEFKKHLFSGVLLIIGFVFSGSWLPVYLGIKAFTAITRKQMLFLFTPAVIVFAVSLLLFIIIFITTSNIKRKLLFFFISTVVSFCPLLCVKPIGPRCFYLFNIFLVLSANEILSALISINPGGRLLFIPIKKAVGYTSIALCISAFAAFFIIYGKITKVYNQRMEYIITQAEMGEKEICAPRLPLNQFVWDADPACSIRYRFLRFCDYYNLPEDIEITYMDYNEWLELKEKHETTRSNTHVEKQ